MNDNEATTKPLEEALKATTDANEGYLQSLVNFQMKVLGDPEWAEEIAETLYFEKEFLTSAAEEGGWKFIDTYNEFQKRHRDFFQFNITEDPRLRENQVAVYHPRNGVVQEFRILRGMLRSEAEVTVTLIIDAGPEPISDEKDEYLQGFARLAQAGISGLYNYKPSTEEGTVVE